MLRHARLADLVRRSGMALAGCGRDRVIGTVARRGKPAVLAGAALALIGVGSASAATVTSGGSAAADVGTLASHAAAAGGTVRSPLAGRHLPLAAGLLKPPAPQPAAAPSPAAPRVKTWQDVSAAFSGQGAPAAAAQLTPAGTSGQQGLMPITGAQYANATTIVQQVLARKMGVRSAVIAIATAMQESRLQNLPYGSGDSLGLFQQRPSAGWGPPQQLLNPVYAANAFLTALQRYQQADPGWASQPLWASAQAVQASGFPTAYAQWESQAAGLVRQIATGML